MKKFKVFLSITVTLCMLIGAMSIMSLGTAASATHTHCICGGNTAIGDHTAHTNVTFAEWTATDSLPDTSGNYVLMNDVTLSGEAYVFGKEVEINLCLNGYTIIQSTNNVGVIDVKGATLRITDCTGNGTVEGALSKETLIWYASRDFTQVKTEK